MMKRMWLRIQPHIIPELLILIKYILPGSVLLSGTIFLTEADYIITNPCILWAWGIGLCIGGLYMMRLTAYIIYNTLTNISEVAPDIYSNKKQQTKKKRK